MKNMVRIKSKIKKTWRRIKKTWFFRVSILDEIRNAKNFIKNIWLFRKSLWRFQWWDYNFTLDMLKDSLKIMSDNIETKGKEVDSSRMKKVKKMRRAIEIIENFSHGLKHLEMAENELGPLVIKDWEFEDVEGNSQYKRLVENLTPEERDNNRRIYARAREIEEAEWIELWEIFKGQDHNEYKNMTDRNGNYQPDWDDWDNWFDGSGMKGWWD